MSKGPTPYPVHETVTCQPFGTATIRVVVTLPDGTRKQIDTALDRVNARAIMPLARNREMDARDESGALAQSRERDRLARLVASKFLELVEAGDTINGYSRKEWEEMNP